MWHQSFMDWFEKIYSASIFMKFTDIRGVTRDGKSFKFSRWLIFDQSRYLTIDILWVLVFTIKKCYQYADTIGIANIGVLTEVDIGLSAEMWYRPTTTVQGRLGFADDCHKSGIFIECWVFSDVKKSWHSFIKRFSHESDDKQTDTDWTDFILLTADVGGN